MQRALLDGIPVVALDMSDTEFAVVRAAYKADPSRLVFPDGCQAVPKRGPAVRPHFAHLPGQRGTTELETIHHVRAKRVIRDVARRRGWEAEIEARHPDGLWQADVLLTGHGRVVAFEVQWSYQAPEVYQSRTDRYRDGGVDVVWLAKYSARTWPHLIHTVLAIPFHEDGAGERDDRIPLDRAVDACLHQLETTVPIPPGTPALGRAECYLCGLVYAYHPLDDPRPDKVPLSEEEHRVCRSAGVPGARLAVAYSVQARRRYAMWHCPACGAKQGDFYLRELDPDDRRVVVDGRLVTDTRVPLWYRVRRACRTAASPTAPPTLTG